MNLVKWSPAVSVNVRQIDDQHKKLVNIVNYLYSEMQVGNGIASLEMVLPTLINLTAEHFAYEEKMMLAKGYPAFASHKAEHESLLEQIHTLQIKLRCEPHVAPTMTMNFLRDWLVNHILGEDKTCGLFLNSKGVY